MSKLTENLSSSVMTLTRGATGHRAIAQGTEPKIMVELYEFEGCPYCRRVREALSALDLEAIIYPSARGSRHRDDVVRMGGKAQFPFLVDKNTGKQMYESEDICQYLSETYGQNERPWQHETGALEAASEKVAQAIRSDRGRQVVPSRQPEQRLELWSYEPSPYSRLVREVMCELDLPYTLHNVARGSRRREAFEKMSGKMQVPYLKDPNTGTAMFESQDIISYLEKTYGA